MKTNTKSQNWIFNKKNLGSKFKYICLPALICLGAAPAALAQQISLDYEGMIPIYSNGRGVLGQSVVSNISDPGTNDELLGGDGIALCLSPTLAAPESGVTVTYDFGSAGVFSNPGANTAGEDLLNYLIDTEYDFYFNNPTWDEDETFDHRGAFNVVLWEITTDFDGSNLLDLNLETGNYTTFAIPLQQYGNELLDRLKAANPIPSGYTAVDFELNYLSDPSLAASQNMLLITPVTVPEPGSAMLAALTVGLMVFRRSRQH